MRRSTGAVLAVVVLVAAGCGGGGGGGETATATPAKTQQGGGGAAAASGEQLFTSNGCSGCHTLAAANATGTTGPDFDKQLKSDAKAAGKPLKAFVHQSIVQPDAYIAKGYSGGIMPKTFGSSLTPAQLNALVDYITSNVK